MSTREKLEEILQILSPNDKKKLNKLYEALLILSPPDDIDHYNKYPPDHWDWQDYIITPKYKKAEEYVKKCILTGPKHKVLIIIHYVQFDEETSSYCIFWWYLLNELAMRAQQEYKNGKFWMHIEIFKAMYNSINVLQYSLAESIEKFLRDLAKNVSIDLKKELVNTLTTKLNDRKNYNNEEICIKVCVELLIPFIETGGIYYEKDPYIYAATVYVLNQFIPLKKKYGIKHDIFIANENTNNNANSANSANIIINTRKVNQNSNNNQFKISTATESQFYKFLFWSHYNQPQNNWKNYFKEFASRAQKEYRANQHWLHLSIITALFAQSRNKLTIFGSKDCKFKTLTFPKPCKRLQFDAKLENFLKKLARNKSSKLTKELVDNLTLLNNNPILEIHPNIKHSLQKDDELCMLLLYHFVKAAPVDYDTDIPYLYSETSSMVTYNSSDINSIKNYIMHKLKNYILICPKKHILDILDTKLLWYKYHSSLIARAQLEYDKHQFWLHSAIITVLIRDLEITNRFMFTAWPHTNQMPKFGSTIHWLLEGLANNDSLKLTVHVFDTLTKLAKDEKLLYFCILIAMFFIYKNNEIRVVTKKILKSKFFEKVLAAKHDMMVSFSTNKKPTWYYQYDTTLYNEDICNYNEKIENNAVIETELNTLLQKLNIKFYNLDNITP